MKLHLTEWLFVAVLAVVLGWFAWTASEFNRYYTTVHRITQKIIILRQQRPADVSESVWDETVGWGSNAFGNICYSERHTPYREMCRFERDLDVKLAGPIDIEFFEWLWTRLAETGPHGADYLSRQKEKWDEVLDRASVPADAAEVVNSRTL